MRSGRHRATRPGRLTPSALARGVSFRPGHGGRAWEYSRAATVRFRDLLKTRGDRPEELGEFAALPDTARMLPLDPRLARTRSL